MPARRHLAVPFALTLAAVLAVAACGRDASGGDTADGAENAAPAVADGPATGDITVWAMGAEGENLDVLAEEFTAANPDATVDVTAIPWDAAHDRIATAIAAGETPDVSLVGTTWMGEFAATGALEPTPTDLVPADRFFPGPWETTVLDGQSYGVPWYTETRVLYYRSDLAEQARVSEPRDWEGLRDLARGLQDAGAEHGIALQPGGTGAWQTFLPFAWQNGAELTADGEPALDSPEMVEALAYYRSFFTDGLSPLALEQGELEQGFVDGRIGAFVSGPWHMSLLDEQGGEAFRESWDVAVMPAEETGASFVGGGNLVVFEGSDDRDTAWKFLEFVTRADVQQTWYETVSALPTNPEAWESGDLADDERLATFGEQLAEAQSPPVAPTWEQIAEVVDSQLERMTVAEDEPAAVATRMQEEAAAIGLGG
jgi:multiple sugar transport system substrate-binding protein